MKVKQIAEILTTMYNEVTDGKSVIKEDLTGIVDTGIKLVDIGDKLLENGVDNYVKALINRIGKTIYSGRVYVKSVPDIIKDSWEYGSILAKVRCEVGDFEQNESWNLVSGESYDPFIFTPPTVDAKFFNKRCTYELPISFLEKQVKESFTSPAELAKFFAQIENRINMKMELSSEILTMRVINNLIATKIAKNNAVLNLRKMFNAIHSTELTSAECMHSKDFMQFAVTTIKNYTDFLTKASSKYNCDGWVTYTPKESQKVVLLSSFANSFNTYLVSNTYHKDLVEMTGYSTVPYWQCACGVTTEPNESNLDEITAINVTTFDGDEVNVTGVIGVIFDENACAICNEDYRVKSQPNERAEFVNFWYKYDSMYMNDLAENCIVFTITD